MTYKGKHLKTYHDVIDYGLALNDANKEDAFAEACAKEGPYMLQNIGYYAGYYSWEDAQRIFRIFKTAHPIFGTRKPSTKEAFAAGLAIGSLLEKKQ